MVSLIHDRLRPIPVVGICTEPIPAVLVRYQYHQYSIWYRSQ